MDSILEGVKSYLGIQVEDEAFDSDILMAINAIMVVLNQLGVGPSEPFVVTDYSETWDDFLEGKPVGVIREYLNLRVKILFDPSTNNQIMDALKEQIDQFEWRILVDVDAKEYAAREVNDE